MTITDAQHTELENAIDLEGRHAPWTEPGVFQARSLEKTLIQ